MSDLKACPFCKSKQLEVVKIDMKDPSRDLIKCRHCRGQVMRYQWNTRHITKADIDAYCQANGLVMMPEEPLEETLEIFNQGGGNKLYYHGRYKAMIAAYRVQAL